MLGLRVIRRLFASAKDTKYLVQQAFFLLFLFRLLVGGILGLGLSRYLSRLCARSRRIRARWGGLGRVIALAEEMREP